jgi:hypothetical protein
MVSSSKHGVGEEDSSKAPQRQTNGKEPHPPFPENIHEDAKSVPASKAPLFKRVWTKLGINKFVVMIMVKPAVAATISMAIYQKKSVAAHYLNFGYLIMIVSVTTVPILPRGKFLLNLFMSVVSYLLLSSLFPFKRLSFLLYQILVAYDWLTRSFEQVSNLYRCWHGLFRTMGGSEGPTTYNTSWSISWHC